MTQSDPSPSTKCRVLVTGATGFVGSHISRVLLDHGFSVIGGTRQPNEASAKHPEMRFCHVDLEQRASVDRALAEVDCAVYLVHGMETAAYEEAERRYAETFRDSAAARKLKRIVYLGGMRPEARFPATSRAVSTRGRFCELAPCPSWSCRQR